MKNVKSRMTTKRDAWLQTCRETCSFNSLVSKEEVYVMGLSDGARWGRNEAIEDVISLFRAKYIHVNSAVDLLITDILALKEKV